MIRLYVDTPLSVGGLVRVEKEQRHYLEKVMRVSSDISVFNGKQGEFLASYASGVLNIHTQTRPFTPLPKKILAFGLIKKHRLAWLMEKACELGATDLYPLVTQRVQFKDFNPDRYQRILIEAAEQCGRMDLPVLHEVGKIEKLPKDVSWKFGTLCHPPAKGDPFTDCRTMDPRLREDDTLAYIIGPEGGFTPEEEGQLSTFATPISMGPLTLRTETAALWGLSQPI